MGILSVTPPTIREGKNNFVFQANDGFGNKDNANQPFHFLYLYLLIQSIAYDFYSRKILMAPINEILNIF